MSSSPVAGRANVASDKSPFKLIVASSSFQVNWQWPTFYFFCFFYFYFLFSYSVLVWLFLSRTKMILRRQTIWTLTSRPSRHRLSTSLQSVKRQKLEQTLQLQIQIGLIAFLSLLVSSFIGSSEQFQKHFLVTKDAFFFNLKTQRSTQKRIIKRIQSDSSKCKYQFEFRVAFTHLPFLSLLLPAPLPLFLRSSF